MLTFKIQCRSTIQKRRLNLDRINKTISDRAINTI